MLNNDSKILPKVLTPITPLNQDIKDDDSVAFSDNHSNFTNLLNHTSSGTTTTINTKGKDALRLNMFDHAYNNTSQITNETDTDSEYNNNSINSSLNNNTVYIDQRLIKNPKRILLKNVRTNNIKHNRHSIVSSIIMNGYQ
mmetsp:Transcript_65799/g.80520  ORF Transcript_65799/g.80520 Transcript_65799/m.80520 type:complete len:141 (+) Transcript_65799:1-423(+)